MTDPVLIHPQPVGAFGFPAGLLLLPGTDEATDAVRRELVAGRRPGAWPESLRGHRLVHEERLEEAREWFTGQDPISAYNRWVLDPSSQDAARLRAVLPPSVAPLVDVVAVTMDQGPAPDSAELDPGMPAEVRAVALAAQASAALKAGELAAAPSALLAAAEAAAAVAPVLAAVLRGSAGALLHEQGQSEPAREHLQAAVGALAGTDLADVRAELLHRLGSIAHEAAAAGRGEPRALLQEAMGHYYDALQLVSEESDPHRWASLNMDLATAQLAVPMSRASDQLRLGVAAQALRACRRVWTAESAPGPWSTATLNLANALIYTPSAHQGDNLVEAVELYEEVLSSGVRDHDALGRARLLANLGNALAHLGMFDQAKAKLAEARFLFEEQLDHDSVLTVRAILDEIARAQVTDPDDELTDLARRAEQMSRIPQPDTRSSGMGVTMTPAGASVADLTGPPPKPRVTVLRPGQTHPSQSPGDA